MPHGTTMAMDDDMSSEDGDEQFTGLDGATTSEWADIHIGLPLFRGLEIDAVYIKQTVVRYQGNPLIEALPQEFADDAEVMTALLQTPDFSSDMRAWSVRDRMHSVGDLEEQFFLPLSRHLALQFKISKMIRRGYTMRNPIIPGFYPQIQRDIDSVPVFWEVAQQQRQLLRRPKASGFHLIGPSGIGKSYSLESILFVSPQVIRHHFYNDRRFVQRQLVWLKLDCPHDGSLRGLSLSFLEAVDDILGTNYRQAYGGSSRASIDDLLRAMARIAALHFLGALVIDEIQMLRAMRGENPEKMLNFFVNLVNTIGVPVLLVGTDKARKLFAPRPAQARRGTGQGSETWYLMRKDMEWELFLRALFKHQYVRNPVTLTDELSTIFFEHTQGITDIVVKLFVQCQIRAMTTADEQAKETITPAVVRSVALDSFQMLRPVIDALRRGDRVALDKLEDIYPFWRDEYARMKQQVPNIVAPTISHSDVGPSTQPDVVPPPPNTPAAAPDPPPAPTAPARKSRRKGVTYPPDSLITIVTQGKAQHQSAYQALQQAGRTFLLNHYLKEVA